MYLSAHLRRILSESLAPCRKDHSQCFEVCDPYEVPLVIPAVGVSHNLLRYSPNSHYNSKVLVRTGASTRHSCGNRFDWLEHRRLHLDLVVQDLGVGSPVARRVSVQVFIRYHGVASLVDRRDLLLSESSEQEELREA